MIYRKKKPKNKPENENEIIKEKVITLDDLYGTNKSYPDPYLAGNSRLCYSN